MKNQELIAKSRLSSTGAIWLFAILMIIVWIISLDWSSDQKVQKKTQASQQIVSSQKYSTFAYDDFKLLKLTEKGSGLLIKLDEEKWSGWIQVDGLSRRYTVDPANNGSLVDVLFKDNGELFQLTPQNTKDIHFGNRWNNATFKVRGQGTALIKLIR